MPMLGSFTGTFHVPPDTLLPPVQVPIAAACQFAAASIGLYPVQGAGTIEVPLDMMGPTGIRALLIKVDPSDDPTVEPIIVRKNGDPNGEVIGPGGFIAACSPKPINGIHSITIEHTTSNTIRVWALG